MEHGTCHLMTSLPQLIVEYSVFPQRTIFVNKIKIKIANSSLCNLIMVKINKIPAVTSTTDDLLLITAIINRSLLIRY